MAGGKLTKREVETTTKFRVYDGDGLILETSKAGAKRFLYRFTIDGKTSELGLGSYPAVSLIGARELAAEARRLHKAGQSPVAVKRQAGLPAGEAGAAPAAKPTFGECADYYLASKGVEFRNAKHRAQWVSTLATYAAPLRDMPVDEITTDAVLGVLRPIWTRIPETASRVRGRIEVIIDSARARGFVDQNTANPARLKNHLSLLLPKRKKLTRGHHAALKLSEMRPFIYELRNREGASPRALEFLILTAARSGEVLGALWEEIEWKAKVWRVPAIRMKAGVEHVVPLSPRAIELLREMEKQRVSDFVFPGMRANRPLSGMALEMQLRRMGRDDATPHGFRSTFRDWAGDVGHYPRELAEQALAHTIGNKVEAAYRRGTAVEKRREMMNAWADYIEPSND